MDIRTGIIQAANALGIDPLDLATAISYETAGTFNPTTTGPTTRFGQHRGFIQFGEPQAKQHGVDWNDPIRSQLGENGAVASYLRSSGVKPGMGLLDIYSAINAGAPGLYNRSDAAAGGAPGTVRDKVMNQMSGHRKKAAELLGMATPMVSSQSSPAASVAADTMAALGKGGGTVTPDQIAQGAMAQSDGQEPEQPRGLLGNLFGNPDTMANLAIAFNSMRLNPDPNIATLMSAQMKERRTERQSKEQRNATANWLRGMGMEDLAKGVETGSITGAQAISLVKSGGDSSKTPAEIRTLQIQAREAGLVPGTPEYQEFMLYGGAKRDSTPSGFASLDRQARAAGLIPMSEGGDGRYEKWMEVGGAGMRAEAQAAGKLKGQSQGQLPGVEIAAQRSLALIDLLKNDPALKDMVGPIEGRLPNVSAASQRFQSRLEQLQGTAFLEAYNMLEGGGQITEIEGIKAEKAMARLNTAMNEEDFLKALTEFEEAVKMGVEKLKAQAAGGSAPQQGQPAITGNPNDPLNLFNN